jgi:glycosyltransferase involved in cell wall biosynthesis
LKNIVLGAYLLGGAPGYRQAGVHQYAKRLLRAFSDLVSVEHSELSGLRLCALIGPTAQNQFASHSASLDIRLAARTTESPLSRIYVEQVETPRVLRQMQANLYHSLGFVAPLRAPCPTLVSVMDLSFITQPQTHKWFNRIYLSLFTRWSCRRAARVIAISEWTKRDVVEHFALAPDRVDVTPLGVDHEHYKPLPLDEIAAFKAAQGIGDHAIFYLGSVEPRKNLTRLIEAFARLNTQHSALGARLFIGGNLAWKYDDVLARIRQSGLDDKIKLIGRVSDEDLPKWYSACAVFAYPSLYEGFGLPVLEAMACGAPVVTSNVTSLPEVVGEAGIMVEPTNVNALVDALRRVLCGEQLQAEMRAKSLARAAKFTWCRTAEMTIESYIKAVGIRLTTLDP